MYLDTKKIHRDIIRHLRRNQLTQRQFNEELGIARSTLWRLSQGREITVTTFLKLVQWLEKDINYYIDQSPN